MIWSLALIFVCFVLELLVVSPLLRFKDPFKNNYFCTLPVTGGFIPCAPLSVFAVGLRASALEQGCEGFWELSAFL